VQVDLLFCRSWALQELRRFSGTHDHVCSRLSILPNADIVQDAKTVLGDGNLRRGTS
jgi:hypothetical protein